MLGELKSLLRQRFSETESPKMGTCDSDSCNVVSEPISPEPLPPKVNAMGARAEAALQELSDQLKDWFEADLNALFDAWRRAQEPMSTETAMNDLHRAAHNLSGMAETYGRPEIGRLCRSLSKLLSRQKFRVDLALIGLHVDACRATSNGIGQSDATWEVCCALEAEVAKLRFA